jgi:hypothetical protein
MKPILAAFLAVTVAQTVDASPVATSTNGLARVASAVTSETRFARPTFRAVIPECSGAVGDAAVSSLQHYQMASAKYFQALGELESGNNDQAKGKSGEIGRFQCLKSVWHANTTASIQSATNTIVAQQVAYHILWNRAGQDPFTLTPKQFALAWHCPNAKHLNAEQRNYASRFENLCNNQNK